MAQVEQNEIAKPGQKVSDHASHGDNLQAAVQAAVGDSSNNYHYFKANAKPEVPSNVLGNITLVGMDESAKNNFKPGDIPIPGWPHGDDGLKPGDIPMPGWPNGDDGLKPTPTETTYKFGPNGEIDTVTKSTHWDGSTTETTERPNGDKERVEKDTKGRPVEKETTYADGRQPDREDWLYDANGNVALHLKNNLVVNDKDYVGPAFLDESSRFDDSFRQALEKLQH